MLDHQLSPRLGQRTAPESPPVRRVDDATDRPQTPHDGTMVFRRDTGALEVYDEETGLWQSTSDPVQLAVPGEVKMWLTMLAPQGYLILDGSTVSRASYAELFALWNPAGVVGPGNGTTTFTLPDMRSRIPVGSGTFAALGAADALTEAARTLRHTHNAGTLASDSAGAHTHDQGTLSTGLSADRAAGALGRATQDITGNTGSSGAHTHTVSGATATSGVNALPYIAVNFIVKY